jgi:hypothetical protein
MTDPEPTAEQTECINELGHHGRERCVFCGIEREEDSDTDR